MIIRADQCIHRDLIKAMREGGLQVIHTSEINFQTSPDEDVFQYALKHRRILLSFDKDFGNVTRFPIRHAFGVVLVYIAEMDKDKIVERTLYFFHEYIKNREVKRRLFIVEKDNVREWPKTSI